MANFNSTSPKPILDALLGIYRTEALQAAIKFNIPDCVNELEPNADLDSITSKLALPKSTLQRLLAVCVAMGILDVTRSDQKDVYFATPMTKDWLLSNSEQSHAGHVHYTQLQDQMRLKISEAVELGDNRLKNGPDAYKRFAVDPEFTSIITEGMASLCNTAKMLIPAFDFSKYKTTIDVGGGVGVIAEALKKFDPDMTVSVLEQPVVVSEAGKYWTKRGGLPDINFVAGDMFKSPLPEADLYILGHVLHCFPDEKCVQILTNISKSAKPNGAVLLLENVLPDSPNPDRLTSQLVDMCIVTLPIIAQERSLKEFRNLLEKTGFGAIQYRENSENPFYGAILAIKQD